MDARDTENSGYKDSTLCWTCRMEIGAFACNRSTSEAASGVKRISNSPGVIWEAMSAKGKFSGEDSVQTTLKSRMPMNKILKYFITAVGMLVIGCRRAAIGFQSLRQTDATYLTRVCLY